MNFLDALAVTMAKQAAMDVDWSAPCRYGQPRYMHQFDAHHEGTCTSRGSKCWRYERR